MYSKNGEEKTADCIFALFHKYQCECNCDTAQYSQKTIRNKNKKKKNIFVKKDYMFEKLCDSNYFFLYITVRVCFNYDRI